MHASDLAVALLIAGSLTGLSGCGEEDLSTGFPDADAMGGFSLNCGEDQQQQQQKDIPFEKQEGCANQSSAQQQNVKFRDSKVVDFDVQLDCEIRQVIVSHGGIDPDTQSLPIRNDGTIEGTLVFHERLDDDGKGNKDCFVKFLVSFSGETVCDGAEKLELTTVLNLESTTEQELELAGIPLDPEGSETPSPTPTVSPTPTEAPDEEPRPSPTIRPAPSPTIESSQICMIQNPCPLEGKTELRCPEE